LLTARGAFEAGDAATARRHWGQALRRAPLEAFRFEPGLLAGLLLGHRGFRRMRGAYRALLRRQGNPAL
jgi:hypothetical protein